jgi:PPOX class probable F420-dependent enzyme
MSKMTAEQREAYLAGTHVGVIAVERQGRAPLAVPIWYGYEPGGQVVVWTGVDSVKAKLLRAAGRFSFVVQDEQPPYRYVTAEGPAVFDETPPDYDEVLAIAKRYVSDDEAARYAESAVQGDTVLIRMTPERWLSTDYSTGE